MSISHERVTARRLVSLGNQQKVNFTQRVVVDLGSRKMENFDFM